jgi:hypothetical protein
VDWWDDFSVSQDSRPYSNKTQKSLTGSTHKQYPLKPEGHEDLCLS